MRKISIFDVPLNPKETFEASKRIAMAPEESVKTRATIPTCRTSVRSEVFVALWDMMDTIVKGTDWQKKARIVLEYDPQERKMELFTFQTADETQRPEDR